MTLSPLLTDQGPYNTELVDAAVACFEQTTISGVEFENRVQNGYKGKPYDISKTFWGKGLDLLAQVED